jgi:hypothetical protein
MLKGGSQAKRKAVAINTYPSSDVNQLPVQSVGDASPTKNQTKTEGDRQQWIGGSVLYVQ